MSVSLVDYPDVAEPRGFFSTAVSGIWQIVWLEPGARLPYSQPVDHPELHRVPVRGPSGQPCGYGHGRRDDSQKKYTRVYRATFRAQHELELRIVKIPHEEGARMATGSPPQRTSIAWSESSAPDASIR